ncbi:MAG: hypothetical protein ABI462_02590 [Ignavibacteria bacterium]
MKKIFTLLFIISTFNVSFSQVGKSPYPIIFVHGLNSDDQTWNSMVTKISTAWDLSANHVIYAVLNARGGDTTNYLQDVILPYKDASGAIVNQVTSSSIYAVNFKNFWNRNITDPRIILNSNTTPGTNQSPSNQSAIYKQGYALKCLIDSVLRVTGASKVILLGHSMGGLAIREYLQRQENGIHKWWIDPNDAVNGHHVAKVITIGTPHLGTDVSIPVSGVDYNSEALRDMRITFSSGPPNSAYLFGNFEQNVPASYYNKDINCNGIITDTITGIDLNTTDNSVQPLPLNILYTWIMSNYLGFGTDLAVPLSSQAIYDTVFVPFGVTDTIMTNKNHIQETGDVRTLVRGLDEPDNRLFAYSVSLNTLYSGYITLQSKSVISDSDYYKIQTPAGNLKIKLTALNAGVTGIALISDSGNVLAAKNITTSADSISFQTEAGNYFIRISGNSNLNPNQNNYGFTANFIPSLELNITLSIEGMWNAPSHVQDTVRLFLRNSTAPYNKIDSAICFLSSSGNAVVNFRSAPAGNYFIQTLHRNALETWSSSAITFTNGTTVNYDFTSSQTSAFGNNLVLKSGRWCIYSGDVDGNDNINLSDILEIFNDATSFATGYIRTDLTGDNAVNLTDIVIGFNNSAGFVTAMVP